MKNINLDNCRFQNSELVKKDILKAKKYRDAIVVNCGNIFGIHQFCRDTLCLYCRFARQALKTKRRINEKR